MNSFERVRHAVAELASQETRLKVIDHLDDPHDPRVQITDGPYTIVRGPHDRTDRYVITLEVKYFEDDSAEVLKDALRQRLHELRSYSEPDEPTWASRPTL